MRQHLMQVYRQTGIKPKELREHEDTPETLGYLWEWFLEVRGGQELSFTEIKNWSELMGREIRSWEVEILRALDRLYWRVLSD